MTPRPRPVHSIHRRRLAPAALAMLVLLAAGTASAQDLILTVGFDPTRCDFTDLQAAIDFAAGSNAASKELRLAADRRFEGVAITIADDSVSLVGGYQSCSAALPFDETTLLGGTGESAVTILGGTGGRHRVTLARLEIESGAAPAGGGLRIDGDVEVHLRDVDLAFNRAGRGGAIHLDGGATLRLESSVVEENVAAAGASADAAEGAEGGGIWCRGSEILIERDGRVRLNRAEDGRGGGLFLDGCRLRAAVPWAISDNQAHLGAGIHATGGSELALTGPPESPVLLRRNRARVLGTTAGAGGAAFVAGGSTLIADNVHFTGNSADFPSLLGGGESSGGALHLEEATARIRRTLATGCSEPLACSAFRDNQASHGAAITVTGAPAALELLDTVVEDHFGRSTIRVAAGAFAHLEGVAATANEGAALMQVRGAHAVLGFTTIAGNQPGEALFELLADPETGAPPRLEIYSSIVHEPGDVFEESDAGAQLTVDCLVSHTDPVPGAFVVVADPLLDEDLRPLAGSSPAIDLCDSAVYVPVARDLELDRRGFDSVLPDHSPGAVFDAGADEVAPTAIFASGFETGDAAEWSREVGGGG